jgi:hypothetical protein
MGMGKLEQRASNAFAYAALNQLTQNVLVFGHIALRQIPKHRSRKT